MIICGVPQLYPPFTEVAVQISLWPETGSSAVHTITAKSPTRAM